MLSTRLSKHSKRRTRKRNRSCKLQKDTLFSSWNQQEEEKIKSIKNLSIPYWEKVIHNPIFYLFWYYVAHISKKLQEYVSHDLHNSPNCKNQKKLWLRNYEPNISHYFFTYLFVIHPDQKTYRQIDTQDSIMVKFVCIVHQCLPQNL